MAGEKIRVLIVEDSAFMRKAIKEILDKDRFIEVIGTARDGEEGVKKARELKPDVITMDINLPGMDGITAMQYIVNDNICPVIMLSSLTQEGAMATFEALELGAFDYIPKPGGTISLNIKNIAAQIVEKIKTAAKSKSLKRLQSRLKQTKNTVEKEKSSQSSLPETINVDKAVAIGISTGGPTTLVNVLSQIPKDLDAAVFIVQHMPPNFTASFAQRLDKHSGIRIKEAASGDVVMNNRGYLAKGGFHLVLRQKSDRSIQIRIPTIPEHLFIPSVGVMMESVLKIFGDRTVGVIMTGMGDDGADAMVKIKEAGGITIAESEETAIVYGMPKEVVDRGAADAVVPSYQIADEIVKALEKIDRRKKS